MLNSWRKKFNSKEFSLEVDEPETFVICQWQVKTEPSIWYFIYRWLISIYFLTTWLISVVQVKDTDPPWYMAKYAIYLTNWGYTFCTLQALLAAVLVSASLISYKAKNYVFYEDKVLKVYKLYWLINSIATPVAVVITSIYWTLIYDPKGAEVEIMNVLVHGLNSVVMILDFWIVSHPVRLAHVVYPILFAACYTTFSLIYYEAGGTSREGTTYIYPILDWSKPLKTVLVTFVVGLFVVTLHVIFYFLYLARTKIHKKFGRTKKIDVSISMTTKSQGAYVNEAVIVDQV